MKKAASLLLSGALLLGAAGCSNADAPKGADPSQNPGGNPQSEAPQKLDGEIKVAVLLSGPPTDGGFCQSGDEAAKALGEKYGTKYASVQISTAEEMKQEAESLADEGYNIIFGHGGQFSTAFSQVAPDYPDTWFITVGGEYVSDNQFPLITKNEEGGYVCGVLAATVTRSNTVGRMVGADYPGYTKVGVGFETGVKYVNPDIKVLNTILNNSTSTEAYETALNQISNGADLIFCNADEGNLGAMKAIKENPGVYGFGVFGDYSEQAPDQVLLNTITDYKVAYERAADAVISGEMTKGEILSLGVADGVVNLVWNENAKSKLPDEAIQAVDDAIERLKAGEADVPDELEVGAQGLT